MAKLQRNLVFYLFYVSRNEDAPSKLEAKIYEAIFDENNKESIVNCLGEEGRYKVKESLKGVISNLTLWHLIALSREDLIKKLTFKQMVSSEELDAKY